MTIRSPRYTAITGAILAGGKSSRMGKDKALLEFNGKPFIQRIAETLQKVFKNVIIISDHGEDYKFLGLPIYEDVFKNCGPLGGIHSAFVHATTEMIFVVSCDLPLFSEETVRCIIEMASPGAVVVSQSAEEIQPLCGLYSRQCFLLLEKHLHRGRRKVLEFLEDVQSVIVTPKCYQGRNIYRELSNINSPEDYQKLIDLCFNNLQKT